MVILVLVFFLQNVLSRKCQQSYGRIDQKLNHLDRCVVPNLHGFSVGVISNVRLVQVSDQIVDHKRVKIDADQSQEEPIANLLNVSHGGRFENCFNIGALGRFSSTGGDESDSHLNGQEGNNAVAQVDPSHGSYENHPEPDENENFFVDDVEGQNAESILDLD